VIPGVGEIPTSNTDLLTLSKGQTYQKPVEINSRYYVFTCVEEKKPEQAEWDKEKENYKRFFTAAARNAYLVSLKEDMKKTVKIKINWDVL
jgi:hypothetical protein